MTRASVPSPVSRVSISTCPDREPKPSATQSSARVAADRGALRPEDPGCPRTAPARSRNAAVASSPTSSSVATLRRYPLGEELLPDLGLSALLEHDAGALVEERTRRGTGPPTAGTAARRARTPRPTVTTVVSFLEFDAYTRPAAWRLGVTTANRSDGDGEPTVAITVGTAS